MPVSAMATFVDRLRGPGAASLAFPEHPIEQSIRSPDPRVRSELAGEALRRRPRDDDARLVAEPDGARVLARTEGALAPVVAALSDRYGRDVVVGAPRVRYAHRPRYAEPWMRLSMSGPSSFLPLVLRDLARRKGRVVRVDEHGGPFALEAEAPLANLLGYADWLADLCEDRAELSMRLARYATVDLDDGPDAA